MFKVIGIDNLRITPCEGFTKFDLKRRQQFRHRRENDRTTYRRERLLVPALGQVGPLVIITAGYAVFQTANNTVVMADIRAKERGVISGMLYMSRNLGLITGASVMGAVFALASQTSDIAAADPAAIASGMRTSFAVAAALIAVAFGAKAASRVRVTDR